MNTIVAVALTIAFGWLSYFMFTEIEEQVLGYACLTLFLGSFAWILYSAAEDLDMLMGGRGRKRRGKGDE